MLKCAKLAKSRTFRKISEIHEKCVRSGRTRATVRVGHTCGGDCNFFVRMVAGKPHGVCYSVYADGHFLEHGHYPCVREGRRCKYCT